MPLATVPRPLIALLAGALLLTGAPAAGARTPETPLDLALRAGRARVAGDCATALAAAEQLVSVQAPPEQMRMAPWGLASGAACALRMGRMAEAQTLTDATLALVDTSPDRSLVGMGAAMIMREAAQRPQTAAFALALSDRMEAWRSGPRVPASLTYTSGTPLERAAALALLGRREEAAEALARVDGPGTRLFAMIDRRLASLWPKEGAAGRALVAAIEPHLAHYADPPMVPSTSHTYLLLSLGRVDEALAATEIWKHPPAFAITEGGMPTGPEARHIAVLALLAKGRVDDAVPLAHAALGYGDGFQERVLPTVILALVRADRPREAQALLDAWTPDRIIGADKAFAPVRACVAARAGRRPEGAIPPSDRLTPELQLAGYLCVGDLDMAARYVVGQLGDPDRRLWMLAALQGYRRTAPLGAFDDEMVRRRAALLARPDVAAAVAREGRILELPLYRAPWA